ncbi:MAG: hypothetical protein ACFE95_05495 [Candidatus Hodarchaeota archaeon]
MNQSLLTDYWNTIPPLILVDASKFPLIYQEVRNEIMELLREGIKTELDGKITKRHALNAQEILTHLNQKRTQENRSQLKISNIYFHLEKLVHFGHVKEIPIKEGRFHVKYYGRTAKIFIFSPLEPSGIQKIRERLLSEVVEPLHAIAPSYSKQRITTIINNLFDYRMTNIKQLVSWLEKNVEHLEEIDFSFFFQAMLEIIGLGLDKKGLALYADLVEVLNFPSVLNNI